MKLICYLKASYSPTAVKGYYNQIKAYQSFTYNPEKATYQDVMKYIRHLREANLHPKTIKNNLFAIKIYYRYLSETGIRKDNP
ncbi:MAG: phage integrase N-terminal SAM-like domain-containing protein, partial [Cyclobacteriaceae bacterium]